MLRPLVTCAVAALLAGAVLAPPAHASLVFREGDEQTNFVYVLFGDPGEANDVVLDYDRETNTSRISDRAGIRQPPVAPGQPPRPGSCDQTSPTELVCPGPPGGGELGDGSDRLEVRGDLSPFTQTLEDLVADSGGDVTTEVPSGVQVYGGPGNDTILGGPGWDVLYGGSDTSPRGSGDDVLIGNATRDYLVGEDGDDRVEGGAGDDELSANEGRDVVIGGEGHDFLEMEVMARERGFGAGNDRYIGGPGNDRIRSSLGRDRIDGGPGDDRICLTHPCGGFFPVGAKDDSKRASVQCATGKDSVAVGRGDTLRDCELLTVELPCDVCSLKASLVGEVRGRRVTLARERVRHTSRRFYDTLALGVGVRRALARQATVNVRLFLGSDLFRTFKLRR